jgi:hypothetical protein
MQFGNGINDNVLADGTRQFQPDVQILFTTGYVEESLSGEQRR